MLTNSMFRTAFGISLLAHTALFAPYAFFSPPVEEIPAEKAEINYVIIAEPALAEKEEIIITDKMEEILQPEPLEQKPRNKQALLKYHNLVREKIHAKVHDAQTKGEVTLLFTLDSLGRLKEINSITASAFDRSLKRALERLSRAGLTQAQPFPPFPKEIGTSPITFSLTVKYTK
ncbi:MAG: energy transducer TonB [Candidatus Omnitrophota bacterium]